MSSVITEGIHQEAAITPDALPTPGEREAASREDTAEIVSW